MNLSIDSKNEDVDDTHESSDANQMSFTCFTLTLNILQMIILLRQNQILECILKKDISIEFWKIPVRVKGPNLNNELHVAEEDHWIIGASCFHLASKFNPNGLHLLLNYLRKRQQTLMQDIHQNDSMTPIHVAATNPDSQSTR